MQSILDIKPFFNFCGSKNMQKQRLSGLELPNGATIYYMKISTLSPGTVHRVPKDLAEALAADAGTTAKWESLTELARNEFICWVENAKQIETRNRRIKRTVQELGEGKRRPCCWIGCIHRTDKEISPSIKGILAKRTKSAV